MAILTLDLETLRARVASMLAWPVDFVLLSGEPEPFIQANTAWCEIAVSSIVPIGLGEEIGYEFNTPGGYMDTVHSGGDLVNILLKFYSLDENVSGSDLARTVSRRLFWKANIDTLFAAGLSLLNQGKVLDLDFTVDNRTYSAAILDLEFMVNYVEAEEVAVDERDNWFEHVNDTEDNIPKDP